jgi:hypothetical protein
MEIKSSKIIFVGIHNKPNKSPLDSSTLSGKRVDEIIKNIEHRIKCVKSNLYEVEYLPKDKVEKVFLIERWFLKYWEDQNDIVVLLGNIVHHSFPKDTIPCIMVSPIPHPSLQFSKIKPIEYINSAVIQINNKINKLSDILMV